MPMTETVCKFIKKYNVFIKLFMRKLYFSEIFTPY